VTHCDAMWHFDKFVTLKVINLIGPYNDGRRLFLFFPIGMFLTFAGNLTYPSLLAKPKTWLQRCTFRDLLHEQVALKTLSQQRFSITHTEKSHSKSFSSVLHFSLFSFFFLFCRHKQASCQNLLQFAKLSQRCNLQERVLIMGPTDQNRAIHPVVFAVTTNACRHCQRSH
jgi:hypothetical protein